MPPMRIPNSGRIGNHHPPARITHLHPAGASGGRPPLPKMRIPAESATPLSSSVPPHPPCKTANSGRIGNHLRAQFQIPAESAPPLSCLPSSLLPPPWLSVPFVISVVKSRIPAESATPLPSSSRTCGRRRLPRPPPRGL